MCFNPQTLRHMYTCTLYNLLYIFHYRSAIFGLTIHSSVALCLTNMIGPAVYSPVHLLRHTVKSFVYAVDTVLLAGHSFIGQTAPSPP